MSITGAELFVRALQEEKVNTLFAYPGGQAIDMFDAVYGKDDIEVILPRHEQGLIHAADGYARSTGKPGVCLVTSGPGAANLVTGIATANYDSVPLVCFTGQVPRTLIGKDSFQEVDIVNITKSITKYAVTVMKREELGGVIKKAFAIAVTGKPGVVLVDIPKDIQQQYGSSMYPESIRIEKSIAGATVNFEKYNLAAGILAKAKRPLFLAGGGVNIAHANDEMTRLAEKTGIPVVTTMMGKGTIPSDHELYVGNLGIHGSYASNTAVNGCDVLFSIGTRFNDRITGNTNEFAPNAKVVHIDIESSLFSKNVTADIAIEADAKDAIRELLKRAAKGSARKWTDQIRAWDKSYPVTMDSNRMTPKIIIEKINKIFKEGIIAADVGQNQMWAAQFLKLDKNRRFLTSGGLGTMGYGLPAGIGAKIGNPDKDVVVITGDGGMQMNIQELATAVIYELPVIICIFNNGYLGNVRQWQELFYRKRYSGTCMQYRKSCHSNCSAPDNTCPAYTPDFISLAKSYGAAGIQVKHTEDIEAALQSAKDEKKRPSVIEFIIEREENVFPIVPPGNPISKMVMGLPDNR